VVRKTERMFELRAGTFLKKYVSIINLGQSRSDARHEESACPDDQASDADESEDNRRDPHDGEADAHECLLTVSFIGQAAEWQLDEDEGHQHDGEDDADRRPVETDLVSPNKGAGKSPSRHKCLQDDIHDAELSRYPVDARSHAKVVQADGAS